MDEGELRLAILQYLRGGHDTGKGAGTFCFEDSAKRAGPRGEQGQALFAPKTPQKEPVPGPRRVVLLVDEADALPVRLLEELRALTNIAVDGLPLVSLVLSGGPILEERFADPQLDMFAQRIAARCYLATLSREETLQYVRSQVAAAGMKPERLFTEDALEAIHAATGGVPRMINQLGDQLVWMAGETGCAPLDATLVQQAWSDLQQLPAPWNTEGHGGVAGAADDGTIEFGDLDSADMALLDISAEDEAIRIGRDEPDADDDMPASIPIATARPNHVTAVADEFEATIEAAEHLLESFDQFEGMELRTEVKAPREADRRQAGIGDFGQHNGASFLAARADEQAPPPAAENPFDEPFDEEEIVLDPYAAFESEMLQSAPTVLNRLDRAFAGELHRCVQLSVRPTGPSLSVQRPETETAVATLPRAAVADAKVAELSPVAATASELLTQLPMEPALSRELIVIEDDEEAVAAIVPGQQFRRLFSRLEAGCGRGALG
jgi:hypothetical protein